jgi:Fumble
MDLRRNFVYLGTLIKIVYFKETKEEEGKNGKGAVGGKLRFVKFERRRLDECLEFIQSKKLIYRNGIILFSIFLIFILYLHFDNSQ